MPGVTTWYSVPSVRHGRGAFPAYRQVTFTVEFRKRFEILHRRITRVTYAGWTEAANLVDKEIL